MYHGRQTEQEQGRTKKSALCSKGIPVPKDGSHGPSNRKTFLSTPCRTRRLDKDSLHRRSART